MPALSISIRYSEAARRKLVENRELAHVDTRYCAPAVDDCDWNGTDDRGVEKNRCVTGRGCRAQKEKVLLPRQIKNISKRKILVLVEVYSSRKVFKDNILDYVPFQETIEDAI